MKLFDRIDAVPSLSPEEAQILDSVQALARERIMPRAAGYDRSGKFPWENVRDINALGLNVAQGLNFTETFYWDMNDQTRAFTKRFNEKFKKNPPTMVQAGVYSSLIHYFKALEALGGNPHDGRAVVAKMKEMPTDDPLFGKGSIRADGRKIHPAYLFEVKKPSESKGPWDYYKLIGTTPADQAFRPLSESACPLVKK